MRDLHVDPTRGQRVSGRLALCWPVLAVGCALFVFGCDEQKKAASSDAPSREAGATADKYATADPKLAKVLRTPPADSAGSDKGPPPNGIFAPGVADARHARGQPTTLEIVSEGADPKVSLGPGVDASSDGARSSSFGPAALELTMQSGPRTVLPTIDFGLVLGPAKKDDGGADWLVADVKKASPTREQLSQLPPGFDKEIAALAGATVRVKLTPDGRESEIRLALPKGEPSKLSDMTESAAEAVALAVVPLPSKPVGVGAQWIAESRMPVAGVDVIAYRAYRVREVNGDRVRLSLDAKCYSVGKDTKLPGLPPGAELEQFDVQLAGDVTLVKGENVARMAQMQEHVAMVFSAPGAAPPAQGASAPDQPPGAGMMTAQIQTQMTFARGDDARVTARQPGQP